jgi:hypothetical protein
VLAAVVQQQAAFSAGTLLSWVLQQLQFSEMEERFDDIHTPEALLRQGSCLLLDMSRALPGSAGSDTARTMLQQLQQAGDEPHAYAVYRDQGG